MTTPTNPVDFVRYYNAWRVGGDMDQPDPSTITRMLAELCDYTETLEQELAREKRRAEDNGKLAHDTAIKLAAERALADRLADALAVYKGDVEHIGHWMPSPAQNKADEALAAWKGARHE